MFFRKKQATEQIPASALNAAAGVVLDAVSVTFENSEQEISVLKDLSVKLTKPRTAVLGLNGSGKSTFLKLFNGLQAPTAGTVSVGGVSVTEDINRIRRRVGLLFSNPQAQLVMPTGIEDVELSLRTLVKDPDERREKAQKILDGLGVGHRSTHSVYDLSGGERQLVALGAVLATEPNFLLLDEPTTLLDQRNRYKLYRLLQELPQRLVISTHDLELAKICDEALVIHRGNIIAQGEADQIIELYSSWCAGDFPGETTC